MNPHNLRKSEKRKKHNRENLVKFFGNKRDHDIYTGVYSNLNPQGHFNTFSPEELLKLMRLYLDNREAVEYIFSYARRYKQAVMELEVDDIEAAKAMLAVKSVMEE